jgi:phage tail-like protein
MYYPPVGFHFTVAFIGVNGITDNDIRFQTVTGLNVELNTEELTEGGENRFVHKLPTRAKYPNLTLKRGMLKGSALIKWFKDAVENHKFSPITINVSLLNEKHDPLATWSFIGAYPVKWEISDLDAAQNKIVVDTIEIAYKYFTRI